MPCWADGGSRRERDGQPPGRGEGLHAPLADRATGGARRLPRGIGIAIAPPYLACPAHVAPPKSRIYGLLLHRSTRLRSALQVHPPSRRLCPRLDRPSPTPDPPPHDLAVPLLDTFSLRDQA